MTAAPPEQFAITWQDSGREPQVKPNPAYPTGMDIDAAGQRKPNCRIALAYPAKRIGTYVIRCARCGHTAMVTTAGRPDDPRSITVACLPVRARRRTEPPA